MSASELLRRVAQQHENITQLHAEGREWISQLLQLRLISHADTVLDYGSGLGRISIPLQELGITVQAVDECPQMREWLTDKMRQRAISPGDILDDANYSVAMLYFVLQHNSPSNVRRIIRRLGRVANRLLFTVPTFEQWKCQKNERGRWIAPKGFVAACDVPDAVVGIKEQSSGMWAADELPDLFIGTNWDVETLSLIPGFGGALWAIDSRGR
jgi:SAM-dependent methyltransferase